MYLSQLILTPRNRAVQRDLSRPHDLHKTIMAAFPDNLPSLARGGAGGGVYSYDLFTPLRTNISLQERRSCSTILLGFTK